MSQHPSDRPDALQGGEPRGEEEAREAGTHVVRGGQELSGREQVQHPERLLRIANLVQTMFQEVQTTELDEAARQRLTEIHNRAVHELSDLVSPDLEHELDAFRLSADDDIPTGPELRVMQAQLSGWLHGLFQGIQASMVSQQQLAAQRQLAQAQAAGEAGDAGRPGTGQYL